MPKFKVGDRVSIVDCGNAECQGQAHNYIGEVSYIVSFDDESAWLNAAHLSAGCPIGIYFRHLKLVVPTKTEPLPLPG